MKPVVREFQDDQALIDAVERLVNKGIPRDDIYVVSHDDDRTEKVTAGLNANEVGLKEMGLKIAIENIFSKKSDELRANFKELGFSKLEKINLGS